VSAAAQAAWYDADGPGISVVVAVHTEKRWDNILACIESVQKQTYPPAAIVIATDHNGAMAERLRAAYPEVLVVENDGPHRGSAATRNTGVEAVTSPLTAFIDDDETAEPDWLERLVDALSDPTVLGAGGRYEPVWLGGRPAWFPAEFGWVVGGSYAGMPEERAVVRNVWSGNMAVRTDSFRSVGGFRVEFGKVGSRSQPDDTDLCIRMSRSAPGSRWMYLPDAVTHHDVPVYRATFRFFLRRCFNEGVAKVQMSHRLGSGGTLRIERRYAVQVLRSTLRRHDGGAWESVRRTAGALAGLSLAAAGALFGQLLPGRRPAATEVARPWQSAAAPPAEPATEPS
jgi:cellulose synthase/poly-beta-1,6-N-acetylglucosamine synthase-like glycosyltransferase